MLLYIDLLKLKAYKLFEISNADLSWLLFERSQLVTPVLNRTRTSHLKYTYKDSSKLISLSRVKITL